MAAHSRSKVKKPSAFQSFWKKLKTFWKEFYFQLLDIPNSSGIVSKLLLGLEVFVTVFVIEKIPYTEIDWKAYMQEVEGVSNGTLDYAELQGDTGPLVYPAGFVYIFLFLYGITQRGENIYVAQYIFAILYLATLFLVFRLYQRTNKVPPYALIFMCCTSYRIHSIYVLRLFNDPVAIFFLFIAANCFVSNTWTLGCVLFSLAVSIKMNIMLFAPGLLYLLLSSRGLYDTIKKISVCGIVQLLLGLPFLLVNPVSYISRAFNIGRIFLYQWTVNWRFLPEHIFLNRYFHVSLLVLHILVLCLFYYKWNRLYHSASSLWPKKIKGPLSADHILLVLFTSNFIGMVFCRSLHYQFYVWYFFTLPYLLWSTPYAPMVKLCILGVLELCWNTYPSTILSSGMLHFCHALVLFGLLQNQSSPSATIESKNR